jgi:succinate dehydrogenase / fumarate reductase cytochrome b subunit
MSARAAEHAAPSGSAAAGPTPAVQGRVDTRILARSRGGVWPWLFQRITAVILIVGLTTHLVATHVFAIGRLDFANIADRLGSTFFVVIDVSLLAAVIFHALNGARMIVLDYWFESKASQLALAIALWLIGLATFAYGMWALWPWISR